MSKKLAEITVTPYVVQDNNICRPLQCEVKFAKYSAGVTVIEYKNDEINLQTSDVIKILEFLKDKHE